MGSYLAIEKGEEVLVAGGGVGGGGEGAVRKLTWMGSSERYKLRYTWDWIAKDKTVTSGREGVGDVSVL